MEMKRVLPIALFGLIGCHAIAPHRVATSQLQLTAFEREEVIGLIRRGSGLGLPLTDSAAQLMKSSFPVGWQGDGSGRSAPHRSVHS
jgi:hypothetical protein